MGWSPCTPCWFGHGEDTSHECATPATCTCPDHGPLSLESLGTLLDDDVAYWLSNPFVDREPLGEKVRWWITEAMKA